MTARSHSHRAFHNTSGAQSLFGLLVRAHEAWLQRRALSRLDDAALSDLGLTRREAARESQKPIWDVPSHWRR